MSTPRLSLYDRLPEIYRLRDADDEGQKQHGQVQVSPPGQLRAYLSVIDDVLRAIRDHVEQLYHDQFIETCDDWVIPYLADLLGTTHLSGDPWTLRADVARTVFHRRRKGTLGAIESLTYSLSGWAAHAAEMRNRLMWTQHLNHQRPDAGGAPPPTSIHTPVRGGTITLRDPGLLSLANGPFDPFAHVADLRLPGQGGSGHNLPNLGIFLWRLEDYTVQVSKPVTPPPTPPAPIPPGAIIDLTPPDAGEAAYAVRFCLHPMAEPMVLFNTHRFHADDDPPELSSLDAVPGPMPTARLSQDTPAGRPEFYISVRGDAATPPPGDDAPGLTLHLPPGVSPVDPWKIRGANLCAWEQGLHPPLREHEIVVDPVHGRLLFGVMDEVAQAQPLRDGLLVSATHGFSGPTGAQPIARPDLPANWPDDEQVPDEPIPVDATTTLQDALAEAIESGPPLVIKIDDSLTHELDIASVIGVGTEGGVPVLRLGRSLWIRAADGQRPVIKLARPLAFRPETVGTALEDTLTVKLEGLYLTRAAGFPAGDALIGRTALNRLIVDGCTLDPGGAILLDGTPNGTRQPTRDALALDNHYGFPVNDPDPEVATHAQAEEAAFHQTPALEIIRSIVGPLAVDSDYTLTISDSIVDVRADMEAVAPGYSIRAATGTADSDWGAELVVHGVTCFGRVRVVSVTGEGAIFARRLEAHDNQKGCVKFSYFSGDGDRLPPHHDCVFGKQAALAFTSEIFGTAGYAQLRLTSDRRILENGPARDQMGAFGYLRNTAKWKNIQIRYREFMPVGVRPVLIPIT